ncbi:unnamed protein product [Calicophoron daubneyi]|uniref:Uncharacterized protein n=1 Tax=Calicophoron daubneyi TaxID=300641 RepID=A0AAV2TG59_CALDB
MKASDSDPNTWKVAWRFLLLALASRLSSAQIDDEMLCRAEAEWGPWRCPGEEQRCTADQATRYKCIEGDCTSSSKCANLPGFQENQPCIAALKYGLCVPWWAEWSPWSKCTATCGFTEKSQYRACLGAWSSRRAEPSVRAALASSCASIKRASEGVNTTECRFRRFCPNVNGAWGEWTMFTPCSATCGTGTRRRTRECNRPPPQGTGLYCQGIDSQEILCDGPVPCPQRGQWCAWSATVEDCSHSCGPVGMGLRRRRCACPQPSFGGEDCEIPLEAQAQYEQELARINSGQDVVVPSGFALQSIRTGGGRWEPCNRHLCPYLKYLQSEEEKLITEDLKLQVSNDTWTWSAGVPARMFDPVHLQCPSDRHSRQAIFDKAGRFPKARAYWTVTVPPSANAPSDLPCIPLESDKIIVIEGDRLTIRSLLPHTTGIYRYGYEYEPGYFETVCFFAVYIKDVNWTIPYMSTFDLTCNALGMWPILLKPGLGTWSTYWEVELDNPLKDSEQELRWWHTELRRTPSSTATDKNVEQKEEQQEGVTKSPNITEIPDTGLTLWDTEYRRVYKANPGMNGRYTCVLYNQVNETHNRTFITESFQLIVREKPTVGHMVKIWFIRNKWHILGLFLTGLAACLFTAWWLWRRARNIARLEMQIREEKRRKKAVNLADVDAKA